MNGGAYRVCGAADGLLGSPPTLVWDDEWVTPGILTRRLCATTLLAQAMVIFFGALVAWQLGRASGDPRATTYLWGGIALAVVCALASGALRGRHGVWLGWLVQALTAASALVLPAMLVVALIFAGLWWMCLHQGRRMDRLTAQRAAAAEGH